MLNIAIIGMGGMGSKYAKMLFENKGLGFNVVAVTRVKGKNLENVKDYIDNVLIYESDEALFKGFDNKEFACDAVLVVTPHLRHEYDVEEAFKRNLHVICDKPAGVSLSQGLNMLNSNVNNNVYGFIFQQRYFPIYSKIKEILESKKYGKIKRVSCTVTDWYRTNAYYVSQSWRATYKTDGGGILLNQCPHTLDILYYLFGMPQSVIAHCECGKYHPIEVEDEVSALMKYKDNFTLTFITSTGELPGVNRIEIVLDKAVINVYKTYIEIYENEHEEKYYRNMSLDEYVTPTPKYSKIEFAPYSNAYLDIFRNFNNAIFGKENIKISGIEALNSLYLSNAMYLSSWQNKEIKFYDLKSEKINDFIKEFEMEFNKKI